jgi:hypothetical protein
MAGYYRPGMLERRVSGELCQRRVIEHMCKFMLTNQPTADARPGVQRLPVLRAAAM